MSPLPPAIINLPVKVLLKRGRKSKVKPEVIQPKEEIIDTEKEVIIAYLPININEIYKSDENEDSNQNIFMKAEELVDNIIVDNNSDISTSIKNEVRNNSGKYLNKINVTNIKYDVNTKCWWCKNCFNTPQVILPEQYYDDKFYCIGNFCSYNCAKAYNIDMNDTFIWKRESLLHLMYLLTYDCAKEITTAPSWLTLKDYGGYLDIIDFRKNFELNSINYLVLHPPLISRQMQIEESYKKVEVTRLSKANNLFVESEQLALRRSKPIELTKLNLETTMGLKRRS